MTTPYDLLLIGRRLRLTLVTHARTLLASRPDRRGWRRGRPHAPPVERLSNHLRRDIGLTPVREDRHWH
jgi:hypothetical protein